jgi:hypothetical protein
LAFGPENLSFIRQPPGQRFQSSYFNWKRRWKSKQK